jgi:hypothetical protein
MAPRTDYGGALCAVVVAFCAVTAATGCAARDRPYRFGSPLLGEADVPPAWPAHPGERAPHDTAPGDRGAHSTTRTPSEDRGPGTIRVASARAADDVVAGVEANGLVWSRLPAPNRDAPSPPPPHALHEPSDLRALVGRRDPRDAVTAAVAWSSELGNPIAIELEAAAGSVHAKPPAIIAASRANTAALVSWAASHARLASPRDALAAGDLLVFARTESDDAPDLVAIAIGHDARGVTEFTYCAGGAIRRGLVDPNHPAEHRDPAGATVNTFLRTGNRWPPPGTHYLAGELLVHVVRAR